MHRHCQLSNLSFYHPSLPLDRREVAATGAGAGARLTNNTHTMSDSGGEGRDTHLGTLRNPEPATAPSSFSENINLVPSSTQLPQACCVPWSGTCGDKESLSAP